MNLRVTKRATQTRPVVRVMESEVRSVAEATQSDQLTFLRSLVESILRQLQDQQAESRESRNELQEMRKIVEKQNRTIEALHALSQANVRKPQPDHSDWHHPAERGAEDNNIF